MNGFFKSPTISIDGVAGEFLCEVRDNYIVRHISVFGNVYYWATPNDCFNEQYDFTEAPEILDSEKSFFDPILEAEFNELWDLSISQRG